MDFGNYDKTVTRDTIFIHTVTNKPMCYIEQIFPFMNKTDWTITSFMP